MTTLINGKISPELLEKGGEITGYTDIQAKADSVTLLAAQFNGGTIQNTGANSPKLPDCEDMFIGQLVSFDCMDAAILQLLTFDANDRIFYDGLSPTIGKYLASDGVVGRAMLIQCIDNSANGIWRVYGAPPGWALEV